MIPGLDLGRLAAWGVAGVAAATVAGGYGYHLGSQRLWEYQAEQARSAVPIVVKQGETTERVVTKYRDRIVKVKGETEYIKTETVRYVPRAADPVLPAGWVLLHDAAATRAVPEPPEGVDVAAPAIAASQALEGVVENYGACHITALQLAALQEWVRYQYETANGEALGY